MDRADAVRYIMDNNIEGCIVECGVFTGNFEHTCITELMSRNMRRHIYMYDTFSGLTEPSEYDHTCDNAVLFKMSSEEVYNTWKSQVVDSNTNDWCNASLESVQARLNSTGYPTEYLHYLVGDVMESLKDTQNITENIAILRLDTDWYESSKFELEQLYDKVVKGGLIIFDDYYHWDGQRKATDDFFEKIGVKYTFGNVGNGQTASIIKC